ncbi:Nuclear pore complex subunit [Basidiobolus ranarum]|uniref:Nuclear pore complex subunit n=1 Tax=Basidiobolus ranarum TaxID=34480 RepID=A0ABR2WXF0_9FUNG
MSDAFPSRQTASKTHNATSTIPVNGGRALPSIFSKPTESLPQRPDGHSRTLGPNDNIYQPVTAATQNWEGKILSLITTLIKRWKWGQMLLVQTEEEQAKALFDSIQLQIWAIQSLSRFTASSLTEDLYGTVQRDIPKILECLLACLITVETYIQSPPMQSNSGIKARDMHQSLQRQSFAVINVLQTSIYEITTAFYENLSGYKFPPKYAVRLQSFMDFRE